MKERRSIVRSALIKVFCLAVILTCIFAFASCQSSTEHKCLFGGQSLSATSNSDLSNQVSKLTPGTYLYYLKQGINVTQTVKVPEGVFIGICCNAYSITTQDGVPLYEVVDTDLEGEEGYGVIDAGGIYLYNCGKHGIHSGKTYYRVQQSMIDLFSDSGVSIYNKFAQNKELNLALDTDVYIDDENFVIPEGYTLRICLNTPDNPDDESMAHTFTVADGIDLTSKGGNLVVINCQSSTYHECMYLDNNNVLPIDASNQVTMRQVLAKINSLEAGDVFYGYLVNDLSWEGDLCVKEGVNVMICLNNFSATGTVKTGSVTETVTNEDGSTSETTANYGNIIFFDCSNHICAEIYDRGDMIALNSASKDWTYSALTQMFGNMDSIISIPCVLEEDIELEVLDGFALSVCLNGLKDRESVTKTEIIDGVETVVGSITYYNCASKTIDTYHSCSFVDTFTMGTMQANPIEVNSVEKLNSLFAGLESNGTYLLYLTSDITGSGRVTLPSGSFVTLCLNGHSMDGVEFVYDQNSYIFIYQCKTHYCLELQKSIAAFDQNIIDFLGMIAGGGSHSFDVDMEVALSEDVTLPSKLIQMENDKIMTLCTCGYTASGGEECVGIVAHDTCAGSSAPVTEPEEIPELVVPHSSVCFIPSMFGFPPTGVGNMTAAQLSSVLEADTAERGIGLYYLTSDIDGAGELKVVDGGIAGICLNGYTLSDSITLGKGVYVYECREQYCSHFDMNIHSLDQGVFDFFSSLYTSAPEEDQTGPMFTLTSDFAFSISEDVDIPPYLFSIEEGANLYACTCGYDLTCGGYSLEGSYVIMHSECEPGVLECAVCDRNKAKPLNFDTLNDIIDDDGRVILSPGSYYFYLENDFQLTRELKIPAGIDLHICLHGYNLYSPFIWSDSKTYGYGYPECTATGVAAIEEGGVLNFYDCSDKMDGTLSLKFLRKDQDGDGIREILLNVSDNNEGFEGFGEGLGAAFSTFLANIAVNAGTINIYGGNFNSMIGFINQGNGVINIYRGRVNASWMGVIQGQVFADSGAVSNPSVYIGEGATLSAGIAGVYAGGGDVTLDGGTINAGMTGITVAESEGNTSNITLNGGNINVADVEQMKSTILDTYSSAGATSVIPNIGDIFNSTLDIVAVSTSGNLAINGNVDITTGGLASVNDSTSSDVKLSGDANVSVSDSVSNSYTLTVQGTTTVGTNDIFEPTDECTKLLNASGEIVILPTPSGGEYAQVEGTTVSTNGEVTMNLYATAITEVSDRVLLYVEHDKTDEPIVYQLSEADIVNINGKDMYRLPISTAAKDYEMELTYYFVLLPSNDSSTDSYSDFVGSKMGITTTSVKEYLDTIIADPEKYGEKAVELAKSMKNFCAAAAKHFNVSDSYTTPSELEEEMNSVTADSVSDYAPKRECPEDSKAIFKTVTITLSATTRIRVYFDLTEGTALDDVDVSVSFGDLDSLADYISVTVGESGVESRPYYVEVSGIFAKDLNKTFHFTIDKLTVDYSVMSYVHSVLKNPAKYGANVVNVAKALKIYNDKATEYFYCEHYYTNNCDDMCNGCSYNRTVAGHVAGEPVIENLVEPACQSGSYEEVVYCKECGYEISRTYRYLDALHNLADPVIEIVEPTCTTSGTRTVKITCLDCSQNLSTTVEELPIKHNWVEDTETGVTSCSGCGLLCNHVEVIEPATDPTCTESGLTEGKYCSVCNKVYTVQTVVSAKGHSPADAVTENVIAVACMTDGSYDTVVYCSTCNEELSRTHTVTDIATGHTPKGAITENETEASCNGDGGYDIVMYCSTCNEELSRTHTVTDTAKGHVPADAVVENTTAASCLKNGYYESVVYCTVCNDELSRVRVINSIAKGHTAGEPTEENRIPANCEEEGCYDTVVYCTVCNDELSRNTVTVEATGHTYAEGTCTVCGASEDDEGGAE